MADHPDLALAGEELMREHGVRGSSPQERIGVAVGLLGQARSILYGDDPTVPFDLGLLDAPEALERLRDAQPLLTQHWRELVAIERALLPTRSNVEPTGEDEIAVTTLSTPVGRDPVRLVVERSLNVRLDGAGASWTITDIQRWIDALLMAKARVRQAESAS